MVKNQEWYSGDEFKDVSKSGKDRKWKERKMKNLKLANIFDSLNYSESFVSNIKSCAEHLNFKRTNDGSLRLFQMYTCKNKQCAICSWRRSMKYQVQISKIVEEAKRQWLSKHLASVHFSHIDIIAYGTPKQIGRNGILFDDEEKNRTSWNGIAYDVDNILEILRGM